VSDKRALAALLPAHEEDLGRFVGRHAGRLLRYESREDLVQGIHLRALERGSGFTWRGREPFLAWLYAVARTHLADRHAYWSALRRKPAGLLRLTAGGTDPQGVDPSLSAAGPSTFSALREQVDLAVRALALLPERDRALVQWAAQRVPGAEQAARLGLSADACESAGRRAVARFRKAYVIVLRGARAGI